MISDMSCFDRVTSNRGNVRDENEMELLLMNDKGYERQVS